MSKVIRTNDINVSLLTLSEINGRNGRKFINILHDRTPITFQTPAMVSPYGYSEYRDEKTNQLQSVSVDLSFGGDDEKVNECKDKIIEIEERVLNEVSRRSKEIFGDEFTVAEIKKAKMFKSQVKHHKEGKYAPVLKIKLPHTNGEFSGKVYNDKKEEVGIDYVTKGCKVTAIVELRSVWIIDNSFGVTFKAPQLRASKQNKLDDYAFIDDEQLSSETNNPLHEEGENFDEDY